jgi:hypothetical protein
MFEMVSAIVVNERFALSQSDLQPPKAAKTKKRCLPRKSNAKWISVSDPTCT